MSGKQPGGADLEWTDLGFDFVETNSHMKYTWKEGVWNEGEVVKDPHINIHIMSGVLHYGQSLFEGLKVFHQKDGKVVAFNPRQNYIRLCRGCKRFRIPEPSEDMFLCTFPASPATPIGGIATLCAAAIERAVQLNIEFVPPYGSGGSLYVRPVIFGQGAQLGLGPAPQVHTLVTPQTG